RQSAIGNRQYLEFRFIETAFEQRPVNAVAPAVFEPEPQLLSEVANVRTGDKAISVSPTLPLAPSPILATPELEVEVLGALNQVGADLGEQINVTKMPNGLLSVEGIVDTDSRKSELLRALSSVRDNPAVRIDIKTVAEALEQQRKLQAAEQITMEDAQPAVNVIPADAELRRNFSARGLSGAQLDTEISRFANRAIVHARNALFRASALKRLTDRFSAEELRTLDADARTKWLGMIREHARIFQNEATQLHKELEPIFGSNVGGSSIEQISDDASLVRAANRLVELARSNNEAIQSAFTISTQSNSFVAVRSEHFWRTLSDSHLLASRISDLK
ncbi:MAG TPA: hypothetical protein VIX17_25560, partial [Pyrinomonadaceae bacterium]